MELDTDMAQENINVKMSMNIMAYGELVHREAILNMQHVEVDEEIVYSFPTATSVENQFIALSD